MSKIKLSVLCITYNHEKFIRQALDGFAVEVGACLGAWNGLHRKDVRHVDGA